MELDQVALNNLEALKKNPYPGRGILVGLDRPGKKLLQVCWIMGRSEDSRNRVFRHDPAGGRVFTQPANPDKQPKDASLTIYNAMAERGGVFAVSNGDQTDTILEAARQRKSFHYAMASRAHEPDPHHTPRISAACFNGFRVVQMSIIRKNPWNDGCSRHLYSFDGLPQGFGLCLTTYSGDGNPLPAFQGEPYLLPLSPEEQEIDQAIEFLWNALDPGNRVAIAAKTIDVDSGRSRVQIINKY